MADDQRTFAVFSLLKTAFHACDPTQRREYYKWQVPHVDIQVCCESLFRIIAGNTRNSGRNPPGNRVSMFDNIKHPDCSPLDIQGIFDPCISEFMLGVDTMVEDLEFRQGLEKLFREAVKNDHFDCLRIAHEFGVPWDDYTCLMAAKQGNMKILEYAHQNGCTWHEDTCLAAARGGHLDCLSYAHQNGCTLDEDTCSDAAEGGHLDCLTYAHQNGCTLDEDTCSDAAEGGHLDCLTYAHQNGCTLDEDTCYEAANNGHLDCVSYLISKN